MSSSVPPGLGEKYIVLELDTFLVSESPVPVTAYAVVSDLSMKDMLSIQESRELHENLMKNYRLRHWDYCLQAIEHLRDRWSGELVTFYDDLSTRIQQNRSCTLSDDWDGYIDRRSLGINAGEISLENHA